MDRWLALGIQPALPAGGRTKSGWALADLASLPRVRGRGPITAGWGDVIAVAAGNVRTAPNIGRSDSVGLRTGRTVLATERMDGDRRDVVSIATGCAARWLLSLTGRFERPVGALRYLRCRRVVRSRRRGSRGPVSRRSP